MKLKPFYFVLLCLRLCSAQDFLETSPNPANKFLAPLSECSPGYRFARDDRSYIVTLHKDHTLDHHFKYVGQDHRLTEGFLDIDFRPMGHQHYAMKMGTDDLITTVRSDPGVKHVQEECHEFFGDFEITPGLAPFSKCFTDLPKDRIYLVYFKPGHTLDEHFQFIRQDFRLSPRSVFVNWTPDQEAWVKEKPAREEHRRGIANFLPAYEIYLETKDLLDLVRSDPGVHQVDQDCIIQFEPPRPSSKWLAPLKTVCPPRESLDRLYVVYFEKGHTLDRHFQYIGQDLRLTPHYLHINFRPKGRQAYELRVETDALLDLVRTDPGICLVEESCGGNPNHDTTCRCEDCLIRIVCPMYTMSERTPEASHNLAPCAHPYTGPELPRAEIQPYGGDVLVSLNPSNKLPAPLKRCPPGEALDRQYDVYLDKHQTLDRHFENIGQDLRQTPDYIYFDFRPDSQIYGVRVETDDLLERIRRDPGVVKVTESCRIHWYHDVFCRCDDCMFWITCPMYAMNERAQKPSHGQCAHPFNGDELPNAEMVLYVEEDIVREASTASKKSFSSIIYNTWVEFLAKAGLVDPESIGKA